MNSIYADLLTKFSIEILKRTVVSNGKKIMTLAFFILIQYRSVTDRRTNGHSSSGYTSACVACYANALVKKHNEHFMSIKKEM